MLLITRKLNAHMTACFTTELLRNHSNGERTVHDDKII